MSEFSNRFGAGIGWLIAMVSGLLLLAGCSAPAESESEKLQITATTNIVADLAEAVAGEKGEVTSLMGPGVDPHLYKATASDVNKLQGADIIFYSGLHLEGRMTETLIKLSRRGQPVYAVTESVPEDQLLEPEEFEGHYDPHVWFDPRLWAACVDTVVEGLSSADPENAAYYKQRSKSVKDEYLGYFEWGKQYINPIPLEQRVLITSHDAYNYFGRAFDFQVVGVQGISTLSEAGLADIVEIVEFIKSKNLKAIFVESSVSPAAIQRISQDSGVKIGGELFSDAMGAKGHMETAQDGSTFDVGTYQGMFKHNITTIVDALR